MRVATTRSRIQLAKRRCADKVNVPETERKTRTPRALDECLWKVIIDTSPTPRIGIRQREKTRWFSSATPKVKTMRAPERHRVAHNAAARCSAALSRCSRRRAGPAGALRHTHSGYNPIIIPVKGQIIPDGKRRSCRRDKSRIFFGGNGRCWGGVGDVTE